RDLGGPPYARWRRGSGRRGAGDDGRCPMNLATTLRRLHGNKVGAAIEELHRAENDLAGELLTLSDQQKVDHEVFYVARDIARWSQEHVRRLAEIGGDYGLELDPEPEDEPSLMARVKQKGAELT